MVATALAAGLLFAGYATAVARQQPVAASSLTAVPAGSAVAQVPRQLDFRAQTLDGTAFSGASLAGKSAVLWFWSPGCAVCRREAPHVADLARRFGHDVTFVGVAGQGRPAEMRRFVSQQQLSFTQLVDSDGRLWSRFGVSATPSIAFVHPDGRIERVVGAMPERELDARIAGLASE
jgi:peroxiredoxin